MDKIIFKLCLKQQIHRCPKSPENYESLVATVKHTFREELPEKFTLSYVDQDGDRVILRAEDDFKSMLESLGKEIKSVKVFVASEEQDDMPEKMLNNNSMISNVDSSFLVLLNKKESQSEPAQEKKIDVVIQEEPKPDAVLLIQDQKVVVEEKAVDAVIEKEPQDAVAVIEEKIVEKKEETHPVDPKLEIAFIHRLPKIEEVKVEDVVIVKENDDVDLSKKSNLRAFIIQTIEESMPQIMENYMRTQNIGSEKKDENSMMKGIMNVANQITSKVERIVIGEKEALNGKIAMVEKFIPEIVSTSDEQVYAVVILRNTGTESFPANSFLQNIGGTYGDIVRVPALEPKKEYKTTIALRGPKKAGNYISKWTMAYVDNRNVTKQFGENFELKFSVGEKKYSKEVQEKAQVLKELLPQTEISVFLELVNRDPKKSIEALIEEALLSASN